MKIQIFDKPGANDQFSFQLATNEGHAVAISQHTYPNRDACVAAVEKVIALSADNANYVNFNEAGQYFFAVLNANGETLISSVPHSSYQDCEDTEDYLQSECEGNNQYEVTFTDFEKTAVPVMTQKAVDMSTQYDMASLSSRTGAPGVDVFGDATKGSFHFLLRDASGAPFLYSRPYTRQKLRDAALSRVLTAGENAADFDVVESNGAFYFTVRTVSGQEVARSRNYESKAACELAIANATSLAAAAPAAYKSAVTTNSTHDTSVSNQYTFDLPVSDGEGLETLSEKGKHFFVCKDDSGRPFVFSQAYSSVSSRDNGVRSLITNANIAARYETKEEDGAYYFIVRAGNHQEIARSRQFNSLIELNEYIALLQATATKSAATYALSTEQKITSSSETFSLNVKGAQAAPAVSVTQAAPVVAALAATVVTTASSASTETSKTVEAAPTSAVSNEVTGGVFVAGSNAGGVTASGIEGLSVATGGSEEVHATPAVTQVTETQEVVTSSTEVVETQHIVTAAAAVATPIIANSIIEETQTVVAAPVEHAVEPVSNVVTGGVFVAGSNAGGVPASGIEGLSVVTGSTEEVHAAPAVTQEVVATSTETVQAAPVTEVVKTQHIVTTAAALTAPIITNSIIEETKTVVAAPVEHAVGTVSNIVTGGVFVAGSNAGGVTASGIPGLVVHTGEAAEVVVPAPAPVVAETIVQTVVTAAPVVTKIVEAAPVLDIAEVVAPVATIIGIDVPEPVKVEIITPTPVVEKHTIVETLAASALATGAIVSKIVIPEKEVIVADKALSASLTDKTVTSNIVTKQLDPISVELPKTVVEETITVALEKPTIVEVKKIEEEVKIEKIIEVPKQPEMKVVKVDLTAKKPEGKVVKIEEKKPEVKIVKIEKKEIVVERKPEIKIEKKEEVKIEKKEIIVEKKPEIKIEKKEIIVEKKPEIKIEKKEVVVEKKIERKELIAEKRGETPVVVEEASTADGCMRWLPWFLGALALLGLLAWLMRGCNDPKPPVPVTPSVTAPIAPAPIKPVVLDTVKVEKAAPTAAPTTLKNFFAKGTGTQTFVMDDVCFPKNTHKMTGASIAQVPRLVKMLKDNPNAKLTIHGYSEAGEKADLWMCSDGQKRDLAATRARCLYQRLINAGAKASQLDFVGHLDQASPINKSCPYRGLDLEVSK
jgi:uncharacterized protein YegP (UPF0339 family)/outer membrane protein OmpA-like peptidoglycan-associated protein